MKIHLLTWIADGETRDLRILIVSIAILVFQIILIPISHSVTVLGATIYTIMLAGITLDQIRQIKIWVRISAFVIVLLWWVTIPAVCAIILTPFDPIGEGILVMGVGSAGFNYFQLWIYKKSGEIRTLENKTMSDFIATNMAQNLFIALGGVIMLLGIYEPTRVDYALLVVVVATSLFSSCKVLRMKLKRAV